jgi:formylglycine-generating enzyme required for sulfatase activity
MVAGAIASLLGLGVALRSRIANLFNERHVATAVAVGFSGSCAIQNGGRVSCWGFTGLDSKPAYVPVEVPDLVDARAIAAGTDHTCVLRAGGSVACWGVDDNGELGSGTVTGGYSKQLLRVALEAPARSVAAGRRHNCAVVGDGDVRCWGLNDFGQLGDGTTTNANSPAKVPNLSDATAVTAGRSHTCALRRDGNVACWGLNALGQLGNGTRTNAPVPVDVLDVAGRATAISAAGSHSCLLAKDGRVSCWGSNAGGQLGDGTDVDSDVPVTVRNLADVTAIAAGGTWPNPFPEDLRYTEEFTCALLSDGSVRCWGGNASGQLGDGTQRASPLPVAVKGVPIAGDEDSRAVGISAGRRAACALLRDGSILCWGDNEHGELGDGTVGNAWVPVAVSGFGVGNRVRLSVTSLSDVGVTEGAGARDAGVPSPSAPAPAPPVLDDMALIPAGTFMMGSASGEGYHDEHPRHLVRVAAFQMDRTEVTVAAYDACVREGQCTAAARAGESGFCNDGYTDRAKHPVNCVDYDQAAAFCRWAGKRLPTEEEWEYAARGTDGRAWPWGDEPASNQLCWELGSSGSKAPKTCEVGSFPRGDSPFGLHDMAGNVWEWTSSGYSTDYSKARDDAAKVYRGGSWSYGSPSGVRSALRGRDPPAFRSDFLGLRCASSAEGRSVQTRSATPVVVNAASR